MFSDRFMRVEGPKTKYETHYIDIFLFFGEYTESIDIAVSTRIFWYLSKLVLAFVM